MLSNESLTVAVVSYNSADVIFRCMDDLMQGGVFPAVIVDNASTDGSACKLETRYPNVTVVRSDRNLGYGRAANLAITKVNTPYLLLLNPALWAAGVFDFETGLELVAKRGQLMSEATHGGMAAVIGLSQEEVEGLLKQNALESLDIANINSLTQIVISGPKEDIINARDIFESIDKLRLYHPLPVGGAFHSRYMRRAGEEFDKYISKYTFNKPEVTVISNVSSQVFDPQDIQRSLVQQISSVVRWSESISYLMECNVEKFEEIGPGKVLTNLVANIAKIKKEIMRIP